MKRSDLKAVMLAIIFIGIIFGHAQAPQPKNVTLTLSIEQAETVLIALGKLPYETAAPVIQTIQQQAYAQLNPPQKADSTNKKKN